MKFPRFSSCRDGHRDGELSGSADDPAVRTTTALAGSGRTLCQLSCDRLIFPTEPGCSLLISLRKRGKKKTQC